MTILALTSKAQQTRSRLLDTALQLFKERGYDKTTMRDIATAAGASTGLTYRYFSRKEELALALYRRLADDLVEAAGEVEGDTVAARFTALLRCKLEILEPHRSVLLALFAQALDPSDEVGVLASGNKEVRERVMESIRIATGSDDEAVVRRLYAVHLLVVLIWTQDRSENRPIAIGFVNLLGDTLPMLLPLVPLAGPLSGRLDTLMQALLNQEEIT